MTTFLDRHKPTFNHISIDIPKLKRRTIKGIRYYYVPVEDKTHKLFSITSVTSYHQKEIITKWRKKVGEEEANRIGKRAAGRGSGTHKLIEHYLYNKPLPVVKPISSFLFNISKTELNKINNIYCLERALYSLLLSVAGTVDCIADYDNELAVIDFKTSAEPKKREWIEHYFVQAAAYAVMFYERTGIIVKKLVILMACENGDCVPYVEYDIIKYVELLKQYIKDFTLSLT